MKRHDTAADAAAIKELRERGTKIFDIMAAMGPEWSYRRVRQACLWLKQHSSPEQQKPRSEQPAQAKRKQASRHSHDEIRRRAASDELTVPFSNWLGKGWVREASEPLEVYETDDDGEQHLVAMRVDPGIMWPGWWDGPKDRDGIVFYAPEPRPAKWRCLFLAAQNMTPLHGPAWLNLQAYALFLNAFVLCGGLVYGKGLFETRRKQDVLEVAPWSTEMAEFVTRESCQFEGFRFAAEMNTSPTATNPLAGMHGYVAAQTTIFPHPKRAWESVPRNKHQDPIFMVTTGSVTVPNYVLRKAGLRALQSHTIGAVLVEVDNQDRVFVRTIDCDPDTGEFWDLDIHVGRGEVRLAADVRAQRGLPGPVLGLGCIHRDKLNAACARAVWGLGGMPEGDIPLIDAIQSSHQVFNDLLDSGSISHHERHNPWTQVQKTVAGMKSIQGEIARVADFIAETERPWCETHVVYSNHDDHLARWLRDTDWREDPVNARFYLRANLAMVEAIHEQREFDVFEWAIRNANPSARFTVTDVDEPLVFFRTSYQYHGDRGVNGARGTTAGLTRLGIPITKAHDHTGTWRDGVISAFSLLDYPDYAKGPSTWGRGATIEHPDGSRQMVPFVGDKYRA